MTVSTEIDIDHNELDRLLYQSGHGIVTNIVGSLAKRVAGRARQIVPVRTGRLRASIVAGPVQRTGPDSAAADVSADAPHAYFVHAGTKPHVIRAKRGRVLVFSWPGGPVQLRSPDGKFRFPKVNHPGTKSNPFLLRSLESEGTRAGFRVTS